MNQRILGALLVLTALLNITTVCSHELKQMARSSDQEDPSGIELNTIIASVLKKSNPREIREVTADAVA